jgi:hypothetical protein
MGLVVLMAVDHAPPGISVAVETPQRPGRSAPRFFDKAEHHESLRALDLSQPLSSGDPELIRSWLRALREGQVEATGARAQHLVDAVKQLEAHLSAVLATRRGGG